MFLLSLKIFDKEISIERTFSLSVVVISTLDRTVNKIDGRNKACKFQLVLLLFSIMSMLAVILCKNSLIEMI
jgi:hypothetical protein